MQRKTWARTIGLTAAFGIVFASGVYAQDLIQRVDAYLRPDYNIVLDGKPVNLAHSTLIYNGSSYLPLKEIGALFGATINWKGDTNTIYINPRVSALQPQTSDTAQYEEIVMMGANGFLYEYLGAKTWVLQLYGTKTYYRLEDVMRLGINTDGVSKVREKYSGWLFVSEDELKKVWKEKPKMTYDMSYNVPFMTLETHPDKLKTLSEYVKVWSQYEVKNQYHSIVPIVADAVPDKKDQYRMLVTDNGHYMFYYLQLTEVTDGHYVVNNFSTVDLEAGKKDPGKP